MTVEQLDLLAFDPRSHARTSDPSTSHAAAAELTTADDHRSRLLAAFRGQPAGLTADEAASIAGLLAVGYWKRVSDLKRDGLVVDSGRTRPGRSGRAQRVLIPTPKEPTS